MLFSVKVSCIIFILCGLINHASNLLHDQFITSVNHLSSDNIYNHVFWLLFNNVKLDFIIN